MGLLDRAIRNGVSRAVGSAVGKAVEQAVAPKVQQTAQQAAQQFIPQQQPQAQPAPAFSGPQAQQAGAALGGLFGGLQSFASEATKNMKICPSCGEGAPAETKFCPKCGCKMPEQTLAQGAVCASCGKQNEVGTKFCTECGAKLPAAVAQEQAAQAKTDEAMAQWDILLPQYPKWQLGGYDLRVERLDEACCQFSASGVGRAEFEQYRQLALSNGFRPAGQTPDQYQLYKRVDGVVYNLDLEHAFEGDGLTLYFMAREPYGGFDYVKPEPKPQGGGLFGGLFK